MQAAQADFRPFCLHFLFYLAADGRMNSYAMNFRLLFR